MQQSRFQSQIERDGFAVVPEVLDAPMIAALIAAVGGAEDGAGSRRGGSVYALRNLLKDVPEVAALADAPAVRSLVAPTLGPDCFPVRGILFDKTPEANWNVAWHQDLSIAVRERRDVDGFGPWSEKAGVIHVQPPAWVLERMLTVRLHLDDCDEANGPLLVLPGSHRGGRLTVAEIQRQRTLTPSVACPIPSGGALLMRPLLLHASSASQSPRHRRVIHLEYAAEPLPAGLQWHRQGQEVGSMIIGLHHAQITVPKGTEEEARRFYCGVMGLRETPKPESLAGRGGFWLQVGGHQVHVGTEEGVERQATKAHLAYLVDDLEAWRTRLVREGIEALEGVPIPGYARFEFRDPFGNRVELIQTLPSG